MTSRRWLVTVIALASLSGACGRGDDDATAPSDRPLRVFAASSLTEAFSALGEQFERDHAGLEVQFQFAASSALARQIADGASADVFASADNDDMDALSSIDAVTSPRVIARNALAIIVEPGNPKGITGLADLATPGNVVVLCAPEVPCGRYATQALRQAGVDLEPASLEENVKAVVSKVTLGEADAGIVYGTDVQAAGDKAAGVAIAESDDPTLQPAYPMAVTTDATNASAADEWMAFVLSDAGQSVLTEYGFLAP